MTNAQIIDFAARLNTGQLKPAELARLSVSECAQLLQHLSERREWLLQEYVNFVLPFHVEQPQDEDSGKHIYMEEEILVEINAAAG